MSDEELCLWRVIFINYVAVRLLFCSLVLLDLALLCITISD